MYGTENHAEALQRALVDRRNEQPLTIAFTAMVATWSLAMALTIAAAHPNAASANLAEIAPAATTMIK
jgi:hypothetical protein